jgi:hypothetical protein
LRGDIEVFVHDAAGAPKSRLPAADFLVDIGVIVREINAGGGAIILAPSKPRLLDFALAELDVLLGDRIVFLLHQLVGHGARILARHIIKAGVG